jgi:anti-sigma regulatory factor (Ser/Thr protein kinase)
VNVLLDELLSNIISYAYKDDEEHFIDVRVEVVPDRLAVTVSDDGKPFNPFSGNAPDTGLGIEEREVGGLGIHLVRNMVDEVVYNRRTDRNVVTLVKQLKSEDGA